MSLITGTKTSLIPISTFTITSNGVVQTGTVASVSTLVFTGIPTTVTITGLDTILFTTTINGSPLTGVSLITDTRTRIGTALPITARSLPAQGPIVTNRTNVTSFTTEIVSLIPPPSTYAQLTPTSEIAASSTPATSTRSSQSARTATSTTQSTPTVLPSASASRASSLPTTMQLSTASSSSIRSISGSHVPTTLVTVTTTTSSSSSSIVTSLPAMPPMNMHTLWWVSIPAILVPLALIALIWLWRKCARKSFDKFGCFLHAIFETIGDIIFGKRWDKWKATRDENRRKRAEKRSRVSPIDDRHIRNVLLHRWNDAVEGHRKHGTMPEHNSPPSTASGGTWRNLDRDIRLSSAMPETVEMTNLGARTRPVRTINDISSDPSETRRRDKGMGRTIQPSPSRSSRTIPDEAKAAALSVEVASPSSYLNEGRLNALAPWPETWPASPHPGVPWEPPDTESLVSHNQWFPREIPPAELRRLVHLDVVAKRKSILRDIEAGADADTKSNASFRGARGVWPVIHPQTLPPLAKKPPLAAAVVKPTIPLPSPSLPPDHPILRIPSPKLLRGEPRRSSNEGLHVPPLQIRRPSDTQWTDATAPATHCGSSLDENPLERSRVRAIASFLGWKASSLVTNTQTASAPPNTQINPSQPRSSLPRPGPSPYALLPTPPQIPGSGTATRRTSISEWTDATVPPTLVPTERARSTSPPLGIDRWNSAMTARGLGGGGGAAATRWSGESAASWEDGDIGSGSVAETDHRYGVSPLRPLSPQRYRSQYQEQNPPPRVPGFNTARQSVSSAYSGYWQDDVGGRIEYDRHGRIRDVEFQGGARVGLAGSVAEGEGSMSAARSEAAGVIHGNVARGRRRNRRAHEDGNANDSHLDPYNKAYQSDDKGSWI